MSRSSERPKRTRRAQRKKVSAATISRRASRRKTAESDRRLRGTSTSVASLIAAGILSDTRDMHDPGHF